MGVVTQQLENDRKFVLEHEWMIRPCAVYKAEYDNCSSIKGRFYQYYRDGKLEDCNGWYNMNADCKLFNKKDDFIAGARVVRREMARIEERKKLHEANDVWKQRTKRPPPNWNVPLPKHLTEHQEESYFIGKEEEMKRPFNENERKSWCSIM